jgi:phosphohistidine phosphatase SixA
MKMLLNRRLCLALTALLGLGLLSAFSRSTAPQEPITVFLVRHAEKLTTPGVRDPQLTEEGVERAEALARLLESAGVTHMYSSQFIRTKSTLAPLAEATGIEVIELDAGSMEEQVKLVQGLKPGSVAVIAGHSNTIPGMVSALGGHPVDLERHPQYGPMLPDDVYDRLYHVSLPLDTTTAKVKMIEFRYGK